VTLVDTDGDAGLLHALCDHLGGSVCRRGELQKNSLTRGRRSRGVKDL
jgi:hypothetical protein